MGFDVFLQRFDDATGDAVDTVLTVLEPLISASDDQCSMFTTNDGEADVYGLGTDALLVSHASGAQIWQVLVELARAGGYAILPTGCATCVVEAKTFAVLPEELRAAAVLVGSGKELLAVIRNS